jgi:alpha-tubulin suppressor-like RCC1 family protein
MLREPTYVVSLQLGLNSIESRNTPAKVSEPLADQVVVLLRAGYYHTLALTVEVCS